MSAPVDRNLALELVRVTEAAALSAARLVGQGDKEAADQAAVDGMHAVLHTVHMDGIAVIALSERGTMFDPGPCVYMEKMAGGPELADLLDLDRPLGETIELVAKRKGTDVGDVM